MHIKETAEKLGLTPRTIRFYEEKGLIHPQKNKENAYRLFTEKEAWRLQTIQALREVGMPLQEIKRVLEKTDEGDEKEVLYYLELQRSLMFSQWIELKQMIETADQMIGSFSQNQGLVWEDLIKMASGTQKLKELRTMWSDRWNFDHQAETYDTQVLVNDGEFTVHANYEEALDLTSEWISAKQGEKGLDIGVGTGNLATRFLSEGIEMCGVDQSKEMLLQCHKKHPEMETRLGNFLAIPYLDHRFDFVVSSYALHHLSEEQKLLALAEMRRVLKSQGRICIADLMFESEETKQQYYQHLREKEQEYIIEQIEDEIYADRSKLIEWLEAHDYVVKSKQLNDILHIVYAIPIR